MELRTDRPRERARTLCEFNKRSPRNMHADGGMGGGNGSGAKDCERKRNQYLGNPEECATLRFTCESGQQPFFDDCGCGCEDIPGEVCGDIVCPDGEVCCNASCGICTPPGGVCTQQACDDNLG